MERLELNYSFKKNNDVEIINTAIYDQYQIYPFSDTIEIKGKIFFEFKYSNEQIQQENCDFHFTLNKKKYYQDIKLKLDDYKVEVNELINIDVFYLLETEDVNLNEFSLLESNELRNQLNDYLHRNDYQDQDLSENIILINPVIDQEKEKVEATITENTNKIETEVFKEKYITNYLYYRVKKGENIETIANYFKVDVNELTLFNQKEIKENTLIQIPLKHV